MSQSQVGVNLDSQTGSAELSELLASLKQVSEVSVDAGLEVKQLLFGGGDSLAPGLIDFRSVAASGADHITLQLHITDRFRELTAALIAAHL